MAETNRKQYKPTPPKGRLVLLTAPRSDRSALPMSVLDQDKYPQRRQEDLDGSFLHRKCQRLKSPRVLLFAGQRTFALSAVGVGLGSKLGCRFKNRAELVGGVILVLMGAKILVEHLSQAS